MSSREKRPDDIMREALAVLSGNDNAQVENLAGNARRASIDAAKSLADTIARVGDPKQFLSDIAAHLCATNEEIVKCVETALLHGLERYHDNNELNAVLDKICECNSGIPEVVAFVANVRRAHMTILERAYKGVIRSATRSYLYDGTKARCPKCLSDNVVCLGGVYEFTNMKCNACGYEDCLDDYQLEEWYPG
jgi:hypothetical protein